MISTDVSPEKVERRLKILDNEAKQSGYFLNPDMEFTRGLVEGLILNAERYGYESCPCRLSFGEKEEDLDIICPCDYRDDDLSEYGACFCGLYLSESLLNKNSPTPVVPERRPSLHDRNLQPVKATIPGQLPYPVFRCKVCGYLCARISPPEKCPICKADKDRFEIFI